MLHSPVAGPFPLQERVLLAHCSTQAYPIALGPRLDLHSSSPEFRHPDAKLFPHAPLDTNVDQSELPPDRLLPVVATGWAGHAQLAPVAQRRYSDSSSNDGRQFGHPEVDTIGDSVHARLIGPGYAVVVVAVVAVAAVVAVVVVAAVAVVVVVAADAAVAVAVAAVAVVDDYRHNQAAHPVAAAFEQQLVPGSGDPNP